MMPNMIPSPLVGVSGELQKIRRVIRKISPFDNYVLIRGESGSGKELVARWIHALSRRKTAPFVAVNAGAFPGELIESEIFGYEKGAFTGADLRKPGKIELAEKGTFFLDEIGDLPLHLQVKLLRVLQERAFERLGGVETLHADVRFLAATHRDLDSMIKHGEFREDLYYRLNVITINLPPLRNRPEDIRYIAKYFIQKNLGEMPPVEEGFFEYLEQFPWYGNIRELNNNLQRVLIFMNPKKGIRESDARKHVRVTKLPGKKGEDPVYSEDFKGAVKIFKRRYIIHKLKKNNWHQAETAREIGMDPTYLSKLMRDLEIGRFNENEK